MTDEERLAAEVQKVIERVRHIKEISPSWIATQVMCEIEFPRKLHVLGYAGCHLELRQMARSKLRRQFDPEEIMDASVTGEEDLFPETLQDRYPRARAPGEEPLYVLREALDDADVEFNVARMRRGGRALLKHADALEAWGRDRRHAA